MTAPTINLTYFSYGARRAWLYQLNASGTPVGGSPAETAYTGLEIRGFNQFDVNVPDSRIIVGLDRDGVAQVASLPPLEGVTGTMTVDGTNPAIHALVTGTIARATEAEAIATGHGTSNQGYEPLVGLLVQQAYKAIENGQIGYRSLVFPKVQFIPKSGGFGGDKSVMTYQVVPSRCSAGLTGEAFTLAVDGFTEAQYKDYFTEGRLMFQSWLADGTEDVFLFNTSYPATAVGKVELYANGVSVPSGITVAVDKITYSSAPASTTRLTAIMEY